jgi:GDPmannose 4,6-dehydratase
LKALILGISGQDGAYLAHFLLEKGYQVIGTSRDSEANTFSNLIKLNIKNEIELVTMSIDDFKSVFSVICKYAPNEIYNLTGQSSVSSSFKEPYETLSSIALGTLNILEAIKVTEKNCKFYNAGSSECFGDTGQYPADELTAFKPNSPYAIAKVAAHSLVDNYRKSYGIYATSGILFNHESPLRGEDFVTQKIVKAAFRISKNKNQKIELGNLNIQRDWGWAPEYVIAMWKMLQQVLPEDFVIATGQTVSLEYFTSKTFEFFGLNWRDYVTINKSFYRPIDLMMSSANPGKAHSDLGWKAKVHIDEVIIKMCEAELKI